MLNTVKLALLGWLSLITSLSALAVTYVKPGATGTGASWSDPADLETALAAAATSGGDVYVAKGLYKPAATLRVANGVNVYGGFAGADMAETPAGRDLVNDVTLISGDKNGDDTWVLHYPETGASDKTETLVIKDGALNIPSFSDDYETVGPNTANMSDNLPRIVSIAANATATLDGLVLVGGNGTNEQIDGAACNYGTGIFGGSSSVVTVRNCRVVACYGGCATITAYNSSTMTLFDSSIEHCTTTLRGLLFGEYNAGTFAYGMRFIGNVQSAVGCVMINQKGVLCGCRFERNYFKRTTTGNAYDAVCVGINGKNDDAIPVTNCTFVANSAYDTTGLPTPIVNSVQKGCQLRFCSFVSNQTVVVTEAATVTAAGAFSSDASFKSTKGCSFLWNTLTVSAPNATVVEASTVYVKRDGEDSLQTLVVDSCTFVDNYVEIAAPSTANPLWARGVLMCPTTDASNKKMLGVYNSTFTGSTTGPDVVYGGPTGTGVGCLAYNNVLWATGAAAETPRVINVGSDKVEVRNSIVVDPSLLAANVTTSDVSSYDPLIGAPTEYVAGFPPVCRLGAKLPGLRTTFDIATTSYWSSPGNYFYRTPGTSNWIQPQNTTSVYPPASGALSTSALNEARPDGGSTIGAVQAIDPVAETGHTYLLRVFPAEAGNVEGRSTRVCAADGSLTLTAVETNPGYSFAEWRTSDDATYATENPVVITSPSAGTTILTACFVNDSIVYTFNLGAYGTFTASGTATTNLTVTPGAAFTVPAHTLADGYEFCRWNPELPATAGYVGQTFDVVCAARESFVGPDDDLTAALEVAGDYPGVATVTLLPGTNRLAAAVTIPANVRLVGADGSALASNGSRFLIDNTSLPASSMTGVVENVTFVGGGVTLGERPTRFTDCVFTNSTATGADAAVISSTNAWFSGCSFFANKSAFKCTTTLTHGSRFNDCLFRGNGLDLNSAVLHSECAALEVSNCVFAANETGGDFLIRANYSRLVVRSSTFADNAATRADTLLRFGKDAEEQQLVDSLFLRNRVGGDSKADQSAALVYGPSRWLGSSIEQLLLIANCSFVSNVVSKTATTDTSPACSIVQCENGCLPGVVNCVFDSNRLDAQQTGGAGKIIASVLPVTVARYDAAICNNTFIRNEAADGTIYVSATDSQALGVFNCVFAEKTGVPSLAFSADAVTTVKMWGCAVATLSDERAAYEHCANPALIWKDRHLAVSGRLIRPFEPVSVVRSIAYPAFTDANGLMAVLDGETYRVALGTTTRSATAPYAPMGDMFGKFDGRRIAGAYRQEWQTIGMTIFVR